MMEDDRDLDFILDEDEQRNGPAHWLGQYLSSDLAKAERSLQQTLEHQNQEMGDLLMELARILGVPLAPSGINGAFRREDFIERATLLSKSPPLVIEGRA